MRPRGRHRPVGPVANQWPVQQGVAVCAAVVVAQPVEAAAGMAAPQAADDSEAQPVVASTAAEAAETMAMVRSMWNSLRVELYGCCGAST